MSSLTHPVDTLSENQNKNRMREISTDIFTEMRVVLTAHVDFPTNAFQSWIGSDQQEVN